MIKNSEFKPNVVKGTIRILPKVDPNKIERWGYGKPKHIMPTKKQQASELIFKLSEAMISSFIDDNLCTFTSDEIKTLTKIIEKSEDRIKRGIIGTSMVISDERDKTIDELTN